MHLVPTIKDVTAQALSELYQFAIQPAEVLVNQTKPEFDGDYTIVLFALIKPLRKSPEQLGQELGSHLVQKHADLFTGFGVIKGFLNLTVADSFFLSFLTGQATVSRRLQPTQRQKVMVEYSSPNTNKPLHLGHLRNNFLG